MSPGTGVAGIPWTPLGHRAHAAVKPTFRFVADRVILDLHAHGTENVPRTGGLLLAGNHSSWLDGPLVVANAPRLVRCLVKSELYGGFLGRLLLLVGQIPVDRGKPDRAALQSALDELAGGGAVAVFPEGTRGSGEVASVQQGIAYLAVHSGVPVLPVACVGTGAALPPGAKWPKRLRVDIVYGTPFTPARPEGLRPQQLRAAVAEEIRLRMLSHLAEARASLA